MSSADIVTGVPLNPNTAIYDHFNSITEGSKELPSFDSAPGSIPAAARSSHHHNHHSAEEAQAKAAAAVAMHSNLLLRQANQRLSPLSASPPSKSDGLLAFVAYFVRAKILRGNSIDVIPIVIAFGFNLAAYAYYVEHKLEESKQLGSKYTAACDIGIFSCTKVFSSEFGYMTQFFGLPKISNALVGMAFYAFLFLLHFLTTMPSLSRKSAASGRPFWSTVFSLQPEPRGIVLSALAAFGVMGAVASCILFYVLTIKLHDLCIVCCSIYVVNFTLLFTTVPRYFKYVRRRAKVDGMPASPVVMAIGSGSGSGSSGSGAAIERWA